MTQLLPHLLRDPYNHRFLGLECQERYDYYRLWLLTQLAARSPAFEGILRTLNPSTSLCYEDGRLAFESIIVQDIAGRLQQTYDYESNLRGLLIDEGHWIDPNDDGIRHINISLTGKTALGQSLSTSSDLPVEIPAVGYFGSIEAYWNSIRNSKAYGNIHSRNEAVMELIPMAFMLRFDAHPILKTAFTLSELRLCVYQASTLNRQPYVFQRPDLGWLVSFLTELRVKYRFTANLT